MSDAVITLKNTGNQWALIAPKGHTLHELSPRVVTREQAYEEAIAWASSWSGMVVRFDDEQDKKRD